MKHLSVLAGLAMTLALAPSAFAIDVTVSSGGSAGASASAGADNVGVTGSVNAGGGAGATTTANPPGPGTIATIGAATGGAAPATDASEPACIAFTKNTTTSDAEIAAIKALATSGKVVVYRLDATSCPQVRTVVGADTGKLQAAINANPALAAGFAASKIDVGTIVAATIGSDGTISFYTMA